MSFADAWGKVYNKSILAFTGRNKVAVRELEDVVKGSTPMVASLAALDKTDPGSGKRDEQSARLKAFVTEMKTLSKAAAKYADIVDKAIKATDKDIHPEAYREAKVIRKHIDWVLASVENSQMTYSKEYQKVLDKTTAAIDKTEKQVRKEGGSDEDVKVATNFLKQQKMMAAFPTLGKAAFAKAATAVQKIKADPTPATYKREMDAGGRDVTQQMGNAVKLVQDPKCPRDLVALLNGLPKYRPLMDEFGNGAKREVDPQATKNDVLAQLKEYSTLLKDLLPYYEKLAKYMKEKKL